MSFADEVFDFSAFNGKTLIQGKNFDVLDGKETNGCGKSNLGFALLFTLFGQLQDEIKNKNVVNRNAVDKSMRLVLDFSVDASNYQVIRGLDKGKNSYLELYETTSEEKKDITKSTIKETQDFLETEILRCDAPVFLRTILMTASEEYNFYKMKSAAKKEFVEKLFDIGVFGDMFTAIHKDTLALDKSILASQNQLIVLNKNAADYKEREKTYEDTRASSAASLHNLLDESKSKYDELKSKEVKTNTDAVKKLELAKEKIEAAKTSNMANAAAIDSEITKLNNAVYKLNASKEQKEKILAKHADLLSKLCDDCKDVFKEHYNISTYANDVKKAETDIAMLAKQIETKKTTKKRLEAKNIEYTQKLEIADERIQTLMEECNKTNRELFVLESNILSIKGRIERNDQAVNPYSELLAKSKTSIDELSSKLDAAESKHSYLKFAESIVSQDTLRKFIIKDLIGILNNKIKKYLVKLGARYNVEFDENMDYKFIAPGGECEFGNFSEGEKMRLMIATSFAFRDFMSIRNGLNANVLILDEYFDRGISSVCVENLLKLLDEFKTEMKQDIYVISHRQEVTLDNFDHLVVVEKKDDISHIVAS